MRAIATMLLLVIAVTTSAQEDTARVAPPKLSFLGFVDAFYAYDSHQPDPESRQPFLYNHNRHSQFNLNLGLLRVSVSHVRFRAAVALQAGTYAIDNYAAEHEVLRHINEAQAGVALTRSGSLWLDVGIMPSHLGFESALSTENPTLSRSLVAEGSPYFLAAAKLSWNSSQTWSAAILVCNGWQRIRPVAGSTLPGFGTQLKFSPSEKTSLNWSTFIGTEDPDSTRRVRFFNNFFADIGLAEGLRIIAGFDIGMQQRAKGGFAQHVWWAPVIITHWQWHSRWACAVRGEYYDDAQGANIAPIAAGRFRAGGASITLTYSPHPMVMCRMECRWLNSPDRGFWGKEGPVSNTISGLGSIAVRFRR